MKLIASLLAVISFPALALTFTTEDTPPYNFQKGGAITGSATDILNEMMKRTGIKAGISVYPWERAYKMGLEDKDTCVYSTTRTEPREKLFKWVGPLTDNNWVMFAKADSKISAKSLADVKQYKIGGYQGDALSVYLKGEGYKVDEAMHDEQNVKKLEAGRIEVWGSSSRGGPWLAKQAGVKIKPLFTFKETQMYLACNKSVSDDQIARMNDAIKAMRADGSTDKIFKKYE